ncbi:MAG: BspA family leucine-rich repeat surface protein, partial [Opitutae bacterium]
MKADVSFTFTNCGQSGKNGPSGTQITAAYVGTALEGQVSTGWKAGYQRWIVPTTGLCWIEAKGARGGNSAKNGGGGTTVRGKFTLTAGQVLNVVVGQIGKDISGSYGASGGGGSFVVTDTNSTPLIVAGGGGGAGGTMDSIRFATGENGADTADTIGGKNGYGGQGGRSGGGGGFLGNGNSYYSGQGGLSFQSGLTGGTPTSNGDSGGFGGGGATHVNFWKQGGGGGGYSGGAAPRGDKGIFSEEGAGGGSFNAGTDTLLQVNANNGHGRVIIWSAQPAVTPLTNTNFQTAVNLWFTNEANATATYGPIKDWNTSAVTNMQNAFFHRATFDENISGWDVSNV